MTLAAGARVGPYEIVARLGAGGMGEVYRAKDSRLNREVAIKVLPEPVAKDPEHLRQFEKEARAVRALNHPNILTVHDVGSHEGSPYVVTELLEGETLRECSSSGIPRRARSSPGPFRRYKASRPPTRRGSITGTSSPKTSF